MPLSAGDLLGPYEIVAPLGAGGMGEVYRAHDTRLRRDVALKVSAERFSERFEKEARAIAALNHPNVCTLHDIGPNYLVMELVEGQTVAERLKQGPIPLEEALIIARQIADALEAAHEKGITHRDLKPGNIILKPDGTVKVLDFGLAKMGGTPAVQSENSPTLTVGATQAGVILGTAAYMAPEQARGKEVDRRADIWAFGVVLYEALTAHKLFQGDDLSEVLAAVIKDEPKLERAPAKVQRLLRSCLQKDPKQRLQAIGDWRLLLEEKPEAPEQSSRGWLGWAVAAVTALVLAALTYVHFRETPAEARLLSTTILPPEGASFTFTSDNNPPAISPDGRRIVFGARSGGQSRLWVRPLDSPVAQPLAGTENASFPFWSPDSRSVAFFADSKLKRIDVAGGPALTIADVISARGGAWSPDGVIVYCPSNVSALQQVAAGGGTPSPATSLAAANDRSHRFPWFLPDGRHFLFEDELLQGSNDVVLRIASLDSKEMITLGPANSNAVYAQGYLLFLREHTLMAQPFDVRHLATTGDALPIGEKVQSAFVAGAVGVFSVSRDGLLAYQTGSGGSGLQLTWFERGGKPVGMVGEPGDITSLEFSPDRKSVAVPLSGSADLWIYEVARGLRTRFTFNPGAARFPIWSPDGRKIIYSSNPKGRFELYRKSADLNGTEEVLYQDGTDKWPTSWSPDEKSLLFYSDAPKTNADIWVLPLAPDAPGAKPVAFLQTPFNEGFARFSPDGKWVAYISEESKRFEIYVAPFPGPGGKRQISTAGGGQPRWRADGKEIYFVTLDSNVDGGRGRCEGQQYRSGRDQIAKHSHSQGRPRLDVRRIRRRPTLPGAHADGAEITGAADPGVQLASAAEKVMRCGVRTSACRVETLLDASLKSHACQASRRVSTRHPRVRAPHLVLLIGLLTSLCAFGQADSAPSEPLFTDQINKFLPSWISFSGEERLRWEGYANGGLTPPNNGYYLLQRFRWGITLRPARWLKIVGQTQDARAFFQNTTPAPPFQDTWDLRQAYAELGDTEKSPVALRVGRQELRLGGERLVGVSNWRNTSRTFDAARLTLRKGKFRLDTFAATEVILRDGQLGSADAGNNLYGLYGVITNLIPRSTLEPYLLWRLQPGVTAETGGTGHLDAKLSGVRWVGKVRSADYAVGLVFEQGSVAKDHIHAWASHWLAGYTFDKAWTPRMFGEFNYATGDGDPKDGQRNTFDQLYATNHDRYGLADAVGWRNMEHVRVGVDTIPRPGWTASVRFSGYWLADAHDALYNTSGQVVARRADGSAGRWVGTELDVLTRHPVGKSSEVGVGFAHIFPGTFLKIATPGHGVNSPYVYFSSRL